MEALLQSVETDLRTLSSESRKSDTIAGQLAGWLANSEHPEVKVAAERAILKLRALSRQPITREVLKSSKVSSFLSTRFQRNRLGTSSTFSFSL